MVIIKKVGRGNTPRLNRKETWGRREGNVVFYLYDGEGKLEEKGQDESYIPLV